MIARVLCTAATVAVSIACFLGAGPAPAGVNSPGIILLGLAAVVWFGWSAGYSYRPESEAARRKRPDIVTIGAAPLIRNAQEKVER